MRYFIIDGMNLAYRSHMSHFEAKTSTDLYSGMFYGFIRTIQSLKKKYRQYKFVVVWDNKPDHKYILLPTYKAGRTRLPDKIFCQVDQIKLFLSNILVDQYEQKGQEADDVIASIIESFKNEEGTEDILIYTNDKDMLQLVEDGKVIVFKPKVGIHLEKFFDEEAVKELFGVPPKKLALFRSFDGDASDSIVGVSRVRRKILASIICEYPDITSIYASLGVLKVSDKERSTLADFEGVATLNYSIAALNKGLTDINKTQGLNNLSAIENLIKMFEITTVKPDILCDLFSSSLNIRYNDSRSIVALESYSLFED